MKKLGIVATIMALILLLVSSVSAADPVLDLPESVTFDEDTTDSSINLEDSIKGDIGDIDHFGCENSNHITTSIDEDNVLTLTPEEDWYNGPDGSEEITCTAYDNEDAEITFDTFDVTVEPVNDAPVVVVSDCRTKILGVEDVAYTCTVSAIDEEGDDITFTSSKGTVTGTTLTWTPTEDEIGSNTVTVTATDDGTPNEQGSASFTVFIRPEDVCGDYSGRSILEIADWDITDDDEDFYPGDKIEMEIDVENDGDEDLEDIVVEAMLYDTTDGKVLDSVKTEEFDLDEDEDETVELILEVPKNIDIKHKFIVFISAYEDGNDDENCKWDFEDGLDFKRRKHDVTIDKVIVSPSTIKAGKTVEVIVDVENVGDRDEEDVYVKIKSEELGVDKKSEPFDVDAYEKGDDDEYTVTITFTIPEDAEAGDYELEIYVYDEDDEIYESGSKFVTLFVQGSSSSTSTTTEATGTVTIAIEGAPEEVEQGKAFNIAIKLTNTASETKEYKITVSNIGDWAESTSEKVSYLTATGTQGDSETHYLTITPKADATAGKHSATINVKEGSTVIASKTLSFTIPEEVEEVSGITGATVAETEGEFLYLSSTTWLIVGNIALIIVAIFLVKMLFGKKEEGPI